MHQRFRVVPKPVLDLLGDCQLNMTFRHSPEILGREDEFVTYGYNSIEKKSSLPGVLGTSMKSVASSSSSKGRHGYR